MFSEKRFSFLSWSVLSLSPPLSLLIPFFASIHVEGRLVAHADEILTFLTKEVFWRCALRGTFLETRALSRFCIHRLFFQFSLDHLQIYDFPRSIFPRLCSFPCTFFS